MDFFELARKKQRQTPFNRSSEMRFFLDNNIILRDVPLFSRYARGGDTFDVVRANVILRSLINKNAIEKAYFKIAEGGLLRKDLTVSDQEYIRGQVAKAIESLPYYSENGNKIYIPIFSRSLNQIYSKDFNRLEERPYKDLIKSFEEVSCDPFDTYGDDLYKSLFTRLIRLKKVEEGSAYYDYDAWTIYFINNNGRLDASLPLFDRYLRNPAPNHMIRKLLPVVDAYYDGDRARFFQELVNNQLISSTLLAKHYKTEMRVESRKNGK